MQKRTLGNTDIEVSLVCLGTMTWGEQNSEAEAHAQMDYALSNGINFFDTAEMYPVPPRAETQGLTETYIGSWLQKRKCRQQLVLASKVCGASETMSYLRDGRPRLDRKNIEQALEASLKRLQTDYLDLYQLHWPDRHTNFFGKLGFHPEPDDQSTPIEETLEVLTNLIQSGKIRYAGISNETPWGAMQFLNIAQQKGLARIVSIQNPYSLLNRTFEIGLAEISHRESLGLLAYSPLGFGVLSGKYLHGRQPEGARLTLYERFSRYSNPQSLAATHSYVELAREHGLDPAQMALAYIHGRPFVTSTIIGATTLQQLQSNIASADIVLSDEILQSIEAIHVAHPNPCP
jgi:aryl-alcohol dehydrogenase-like predicted oxidoreductase